MHWKNVDPTVRLRIQTAALLVVGVAAVMLAPPLAMQVLLACMVAILAWEWAQIFRYGVVQQGAFFLLLTSVGALGPWISMLQVSQLGSVLWLGLTGLCVHVGRGGRFCCPPAYSMVLGLGVLLPLFWLGSHLREAGAAVLGGAMVLVALTDTVAFFVGRAYGRRRLAVRLSPGKSIEGAVGAVLCIGLLACWVDVRVAPYAMLVAMASIVGDLFESLCKRQAGVKDSGRCLPGHGGLWDRCDGLLAALPLYALGWQYAYGG